MRRFPSLVLLAPVLLLALSAVPVSAQAPPSVGPAPTPITSLVAQVTALFPKVEGDVLKVAGGEVTLSIGRRDGIVAGVELMVVHEGEELKHPKTGEVLGKKEETVGRVRVEEVAEAYSVARVTTSKSGGIAPGDKARVSSGKIRLTVLPLSTGIRDNLIEAAVQELVDGLTRTGRFKAENVLVLHFKRVDTKPYMDVRLYELPRPEAALTTAFFVPPSIRPTTQGSRFSQGGSANPPQAKQRSLLARLLGRELEAGSYSSGENTIPLREVAKFPFAALAIDVGIMPKDKIPRMVVSDGYKVYMYKVVGTKLEPEWSM